MLAAVARAGLAGNLSTAILTAMKTRFCAVLLAVFLASTSHAQSPERWAADIVDAYRHATPLNIDGTISPRVARQAQSEVVESLRTELGDVFGYKAGLTSAAAQQRFNVDEPILGILLWGMLLDDGATVSVADGVRLMIEADLLVRVKSEDINAAATPAEAFQSIDFVAPFLEIPDIIIAPGQPMDGALLTAVNSGARYGIIGTPVPTRILDMADLDAFTATLTRDGEAVGPTSTGEALMGGPLEVVLWMVREARDRGITLESGDWLSLGSLTAPVEARPGELYHAVYEGLGDEPLHVSVGFAE